MEVLNFLIADFLHLRLKSETLKKNNKSFESTKVGHEWYNVKEIRK